MKILFSWLLLTLEILVIAHFLPFVHVSNFKVGLTVALIIGILNAVVKPIISVVTLPINFLTFGMFAFILNTLLILLIPEFISGFKINGFVGGVLFNLILAVTSSFVNFALNRD